MKYFLFNVFTMMIPFTLLASTNEVITLNFEDFRNSVIKESPDLLVEQSILEAAKARAEGIRMDSPMVGLMKMTEGSTSKSGFEITQNIPFPSKLIKDHKIRDHEHETQKLIFQYQKAQILNEARSAYIGFWSSYEKLQILKDKRHWLNHHVSIAKSLARTDSGAQSHLLEVESDKDMIENEVLGMEAELVEKAVALQIFNPSLKSENLKPMEPSLPEIDSNVEISFEKAKEGDAKAGASILSVKEMEVITSKEQETLSKKSYLPDFTLRFKSYNESSMSEKSQEWMIGMSLPFVYFWQPKAQSAEATAQRMRSEAELQKIRIEYKSKILTLSKKMKSLKIQIKNLEEKLIPRAEKRKKLVLNISTRTMEGLGEHKIVELGLLDLRMKLIEARVEYENSFKELTKLTGGYDYSNPSIN